MNSFPLTQRKTWNRPRFNSERILGRTYLSLPPSHRLSRTVNKTPWQICIDSLQSSENKIFLVQPLSIVMLHFPQGFLRVFVRFPSCLALPTLLIYISCAHPLVFSCLVDPLHLWVTPSGASQPSVIITVVCHSRALPVRVKRFLFAPLGVRKETANFCSPFEGNFRVGVPDCPQRLSSLKGCLRRRGTWISGKYARANVIKRFGFWKGWRVGRPQIANRLPSA